MGGAGSRGRGQSSLSTFIRDENSSTSELDEGNRLKLEGYRMSILSLIRLNK